MSGEWKREEKAKGEQQDFNENQLSGLARGGGNFHVLIFWKFKIKFYISFKI